MGDRQGCRPLSDAGTRRGLTGVLGEASAGRGVGQMPRFFIRIEAEDHRQGAPPQHIGGEGRWVRTWTEKVWADSPEAALEVAEHQARERTGILDCKAAQVASAPEVEARFWQGTRPREEQAEAETLALQTNALKSRRILL